MRPAWTTEWEIMSQKLSTELPGLMSLSKFKGSWDWTPELTSGLHTTLSHKHACTCPYMEFWWLHPLPVSKCCTMIICPKAQLCAPVSGQGCEATAQNCGLVSVITTSSRGCWHAYILNVREIRDSLEPQNLHPSSRRFPLSSLVARRAATCPDSQRAHKKYLFCVSCLTD